jgi:hypothetical protein
MTDPMTAAKRDLEERDRMAMLAQDARAILNRLDGWRGWPKEWLIDELLEIMSWGDAQRVLEYIDWEDDHAAQCRHR